MDKLSKATLFLAFNFLSVIGAASADRLNVLSQDEHLLAFAYLLSGMTSIYAMLCVAAEIYKRYIKKTELIEIFAILGFSGLILVVHGVTYFLIKQISKSLLLG
ncbi:hypothetical protein [Vibrio alginolyticus]|uniref:hypothetical protein n=1 Tax=Vibrio alginolyticus TaxID=663 RepID=UPI0006CA93E0|nr:hypothetical protein [Vibrio alginolyticus]KPM98367.1 hypothetical protein AOG25_07930 [Vibrio alginolyticus]